MNQMKIKTIEKADKLSSYWMNSFWLLVFISITGILFNFGQLATPYFQGLLIDDIASQYEFSIVLKTALVYVGVLSFVQLMRMFKRYLIRRFANDVQTEMRLMLYNNILHQSEKELSSFPIGTLLSRCLSDVKEAVEGMRKLTTEIFDTVFVFIFYFIYLMFFDSRMTLIAFVPVAIAIGFAFLLRKKNFETASQARKVNSRMSQKTFDLYDHALLYRIYGRDDDNLSAYDAILKDYEKANVKNSVLTDTMIPLVNLIGLIGLIPIVLMGSRHVIREDFLTFAIPNIMKDRWTIGQFSTYITSFILLTTKASHTARLFSSIEKGLSSWKRIKPYIKPYASYPDAEEVKGETLSIQNFTLTVADRDLIHNLNLKAQKGEILGITGPIASGKSALGKVFLQDLPYSGQVSLFGKELKNYTPEEISGTVTYMGHKSELLTDTIEENVSLGGKKEVMPYLSLVDFEEDMQEMKDKEKTVIGNEGVRLSGGQQERIALARSFYHQKGLMVLDDPFASVDVRTEKKIWQNLKDQRKDSLILLMSHRLACFPDVDEVLFLHGDGTYALGTHEELLQRDEAYRNLYQLQMKEEESYE